MNVLLSERTRQSLYLELYFDSKLISKGTGFVVRHTNFLFLVSNYHVLTGKNPITEKPLHPMAAIPNRVIVHHHIGPTVSNFKTSEFQLSQNEKSLVKRHKNMNVDVGILKIESSQFNDFYPIETDDLKNTEFRIDMLTDIVVIGFPFGLSGGYKFPIWKKGSLSSEWDLDFNHQSCCLIDASTRKGMSGSPVFAIVKSPIHLKNGKILLAHKSITPFLGIYSGTLKFPENDKNQFSKEDLEIIDRIGTDIGLIWKWYLIEEIINDITY